MAIFNEKTRVQIPAMVHLTRLGYEYVGKLNLDDIDKKYHGKTNILIKEFIKKFVEFNNVSEKEAIDEIENLSDIAYNDDLGKEFYNKLINNEKYKYIDFENPNNNSWLFSGELTCYTKEGNYRPDITLFINGLPLTYIEVKKPNNPGGILEELKREYRQRNKPKYRRFRNITQLMIFSNNMEYNNIGGTFPIQGNFYSTPNGNNISFNCFREDNFKGEDFIKNYDYKTECKKTESQILEDFNCESIFSTPEYNQNKEISSPTNKILTSLCSRQRFLFMLKYGISFLNGTKTENGKTEYIKEKHILRYQQYFALQKTLERVKTGKGGIIWHTQGSGKTALSYNLTKVLSDFYKEQNIIPKYYFIVDRLDLLTQASSEFELRGLDVETYINREALMTDLKNPTFKSPTGNNEISVVNIHKFGESSENIEVIDNYNKEIQKIFFIDEAHRGYKNDGTFLANLLDADKNAIKIALTGTPLIGDEKATWKIFGDYIHTYYYDQSIKDGYTVPITRFDIATYYKLKLENAYTDAFNSENNTNYKDFKDLQINEKDIKRNDIICHKVYVKALALYIIDDFKNFREAQEDYNLGGMIVCENGQQAKVFNEIFPEVIKKYNEDSNIEQEIVAKLVNCYEDREETRKIINDFKYNHTVDLLIVDYMLLTGFDSHNLKRMYLGKKFNDHNLLQAITRVNRTYNKNNDPNNPMRSGYIIDFADIKENLKETNERYENELTKINNEITEITNGDEIKDNYFRTTEIIEKELLDNIKEISAYNLDNIEAVRIELDKSDDLNNLRNLKKAIENIKNLHNEIRISDSEEIKEKFKDLKIDQIRKLFKVVSDRIEFINLINDTNNDDTDIKEKIQKFLNIVDFSFKEIDRQVLEISDGGSKLAEKIKKTINEINSAISSNIDQKDPQFISLSEAILKKLSSKGNVIADINDLEDIEPELEKDLKELELINEENNKLYNMYEQDSKYVSIHKRIKEKNIEQKQNNLNAIISEEDEIINKILLGIRTEINNTLYNNIGIKNNGALFTANIKKNIIKQYKESNIYSKVLNDINFISEQIYEQYIY